MKTLRIADSLTLPVDAVTQTIAILAKRRAGKSYTARRLAEQLCKSGQQIIVVDPKGDWWGIRGSADGKSPGLPITILGGEHADVALEAGAGEVVGKLAVEEGVSMLLDLSLFRKHEVATFMAAFLETLYRLKAQERYRTPVMLIIDEADAIAPQKPFHGEERMLGAAEDIVRRGGQRGLGCIMVSQRSAVLNKNLLTQLEVLVALRTISPQDMAAVDAWIEKHGSPERRKVLMDSLPSLPIGDAWFWSPGWPTEAGIFQRVHVLPIETFDSGATPKSGEKRAEPKNLAPVDLEALRQRMASTIERAKADDPKELRKRIAELEKAAKAKPDAAPAAKADPAALATAEKRGYARAVAEAKRAFSPLQKAAESAIKALQASIPAELEWNNSVLEESVSNPARSAPNPIRSPSPRIQHNESANGNGSLTGPEQRILDAIAWMESMGIETPEQVAVAFLAGYTYGGGGFNNPRGALRTKGLLEYVAGDRIRLTEEGQKSATYPDMALTTTELQARVLDRLPGPERRILEVILASYPKSLDSDECARKAGYTPGSGGFNNPRGRLRTLGLIEYSQPGFVRARDLLFLDLNAEVA